MKFNLCIKKLLAKASNQLPLEDRDMACAVYILYIPIYRKYIGMYNIYRKNIYIYFLYIEYIYIYQLIKVVFLSTEKTEAICFLPRKRNTALEATN